MFRRKRTLTFHQKKKIITPKLIREIFSWLFVTAMAVLIAAFLVLSFGEQVKIIGDSMEPTIYNGQGVLVNRLFFKILSPHKGDIVVFLPNGNVNSHYYVKRVVAVPGDTVQITDGLLYINGEPADEKEGTFDKMEDAGIAENEIKLGSGEYFVLGDNRNSSEDSRSANIGIVGKSMIIGEAWFKLKRKEAPAGPILNNY
ncbi:MAG: signal peptidase I [Butyrivibrio sp.]|nr:signal peptidase I [Butyrivibrio sp.]